MAEERYSKIFALLPQKAPESDCVIVEAGALLNDNKENIRIAQLKLKNARQGDARLTKAKVIVYYTVKDAEISNSYFEYEYKNLAVGENESFGPKSPIPLPEERATKFQVIVSSATYSDGSTWNNKDGKNAYLYEKANKFLAKANDPSSLAVIAKMLKSLGGYLDSSEKVAECDRRGKEITNKGSYEKAKKLMAEGTSQSLKKAMDLCSSMGDWADAKALLEKCRSQREKALKKEEEEAQAEAERIAEEERQAKKRKKMILAISATATTSAVAFILVLFNLRYT